MATQRTISPHANRDAPLLVSFAQQLLAAGGVDHVGVYLMGSHGSGTALPTSDIDIAVVFGGIPGDGARMQMAELLARIPSINGAIIECTIVDSRDIARGLTPNLVRARLLAGNDLLAARPLRPLPELLIYYVGLAMSFIHLLHVLAPGGSLPLPIIAPNPNDLYFGYTDCGIRISPGKYRRGTSAIAKLVMAIASFRLAALGGIVTYTREDVRARYGEVLPRDPWLELVTTVYDFCRCELRGEMPITEVQEKQLTNLCGQLVAFENDNLDLMISRLPAWLPHADDAFAGRVSDTLAGVRCDSPDVKNRLLGLKNALAQRRSPRATS